MRILSRPVRVWAALPMLLGLAGATVRAADSPAMTMTLTRADPRLDALISPKAKLRLVASGFGFIDTPVWVRGRNGEPGYLLASSIIDNVVYKVTSAGKVSVFLDKAGYSGENFAVDGKLAQIGRARVILMGPGCVAVDAQGRIIWCAGQDRALKRLEMDGTRTVLADAAEGRRFNGPNDVALAADGSIYFTDSDVGLRGGINGGLAQMPDSVWRWSEGRVTRVVSREELGAEPNGIALSPDGKHLYLSAGTMSPDPRIMRYPVNADGSVGPGMLFTHGPGIGDGMKTDRAGNLWSTQPVPGVVRVTAPDGALLGLLHLPAPVESEPRKTHCASSLAFGEDDARTLYIAACENIYAVPLRSPGVLQGPEPTASR